MNEWSHSLLPVRGDGSGKAVITGQTVNLALNQNETELAVLVLPVLLQMLADVNCLLDKLVKILWELRSESVGLEDTDDFVSGNVLDLGNSVGITEDDSNLRWRQTLLGELANLVNNLLSASLQPRGRGAAVRE
jgi:hypothetical protein